MITNCRIKKITASVLLVCLGIISSCEKPEDNIVKAVNETNEILVNNDWSLSSFEIIVGREDIPPPLLFPILEFELSGGAYDLDDMVLDEKEMKTYTVDFSPERQIFTKGGEINLLLDAEIGSYFVVNDKTIRIKSEETLLYDYQYNEASQEFFLIANEGSARRLINKANQKLIDAVSGTGTSVRLADYLTNLLFTNEDLQLFINDLVVDAVSGQLDFINELDPEETSLALAQLIIQELENVDWEQFIYETILNQLDGISNIDPEAVATLISAELSDYINEAITEDGIKNILLPYISQIPVNSEAITETIANLVNDLFLSVFSEENLLPIVTSAWDEYVSLSPDQISAIADTLTGVLKDLFFNQDGLSNTVLPFTQLIDETSLLQMGQLAQSTTDEIENLVNSINAAFPELELSPDYENMQNSIRLAYIGIKPIIAVIGAERAADQIADLLLEVFFTDQNLQSVLVAALEFFQRIDSDDAGQFLAQWLLELEDEISEVLYAFIVDSLGPILDNLDPERTSFLIAQQINIFISEALNQENIYDLIFPLLVEISELSAEEVAGFLADLIVNLEFIEEGITKENIASILQPFLESVQETNVEEVVQELVTALVNSEFFQENITEERVLIVLKLLIYKSYWDDVQIANNFEELIIVLKHD